MKIFRFLLRVVLGVLFVGHGTHKLFGWFGGRGLKATAEMFESIGLQPGAPHAVLAGASEAVGGALMAAGYLTPLAGASMMGSMLTAIHRVHLPKGPWVTEGGYEYNLVIILAVLTLVEAGPGPLSVDALKGTERAGTGWALASLAAAGLGAAGVHLANGPAAPPAQS